MNDRQPSERYTVHNMTGIFFLCCFGVALFLIALLLSVRIVMLDSGVWASTDIVLFKYYVIPLFSFFTLLSAWGAYSIAQSRIEVNGTALKVFSPFKRSKSYRISQISSRRALPFGDEMTGAFQSFFGMIAALSAKPKEKTVWDITYYINGEAVIFMNTGMKNADRLDSSVREQLASADRTEACDRAVYPKKP